MGTTGGFNYLALGDSYTIGEAVSPTENFPNMVCALLKQKGHQVQPPRIIAKTGWTTDELDRAITEATVEEPLLDKYDLVTLLIGVNDQYRGYPIESYALQFEALLNKAISFAGGIRQNVVVLSIPDWSVTPFAADRDREQVASEIDNYNRVNKRTTGSYNIHYIDITPLTRESAHDPSLIAHDGLHPSGKEYNRWAALISGYVAQQYGW